MREQIEILIFLGSFMCFFVLTCLKINQLISFSWIEISATFIVPILGTFIANMICEAMNDWDKNRKDRGKK